jgi:diacylglycerol kinase
MNKKGQTMKSVLSALFNPTPAPVPMLRSQRNRRVLVSLIVGLIVLATILALSKQSTLGLIAAIVSYLLIMVLNYATRNITSSLGAQADEREQQRDSVHRSAYWTMMLLLGMIVGTFWGINTAEPGSIRGTAPPIT